MCIHKGQWENWNLSREYEVETNFFFSSKPNLNIVTLVYHSGIERWKEHIRH